jgi:multiple antibiotic resistance protein
VALLQYAILAAVPLFAIVNPIAAVPAFLAMTPRDSSEERLRMAFKGAYTCAGVLLTFALLGTQIFQIFGISMPSFRIAGGLILLLVSLDNLQARRTGTKVTEEETQEGVQKADISITPLAVPMLSGPGAISTVIVLKSRAESLAEHAVLYAVILAVSAAAYVAFHVAVKSVKKLHHIPLNVVTRLTGLLLAATGVEFIMSGIKAHGLLGG